MNQTPGYFRYSFKESQFTRLESQVITNIIKLHSKKVDLIKKGKSYRKIDQKFLSEKNKCSRRTITSAIKKAKEAGFLFTYQPSGFKRTNYYTIDSVRLAETLAFKAQTARKNCAFHEAKIAHSLNIKDLNKSFNKIIDKPVKEKVEKKENKGKIKEKACSEKLTIQEMLCALHQANLLESDRPISREYAMMLGALRSEILEKKMDLYKKEEQTELFVQGIKKIKEKYEKEYLSQEEIFHKILSFKEWNYLYSMNYKVKLKEIKLSYEYCEADKKLTSAHVEINKSDVNAEKKRKILEKIGSAEYASWFEKMKWRDGKIIFPNTFWKETVERKYGSLIEDCTNWEIKDYVHFQQNENEEEQPLLCSSPLSEKEVALRSFEKMKNELAAERKKDYYYNSNTDYTLDQDIKLSDCRALVPVKEIPYTVLEAFKEKLSRRERFFFEKSSVSQHALRERLARRSKNDPLREKGRPDFQEEYLSCYHMNTDRRRKAAERLKRARILNGAKEEGFIPISKVSAFYHQATEEAKETLKEAKTCFEKMILDMKKELKNERKESDRKTIDMEARRIGENYSCW